MCSRHWASRSAASEYCDHANAQEPAWGGIAVQNVAEGSENGAAASDIATAVKPEKRGGQSK